MVPPSCAITASGKPENGVPMLDLEWASTSSMACFPAAESAKFQAKLMYAAQIPGVQP
jgi:hypothetical protein